MRLQSWMVFPWTDVNQWKGQHWPAENLSLKTAAAKMERAQQKLDGFFSKNHGEKESKKGCQHSITNYKLQKVALFIIHCSWIQYEKIRHHNYMKQHLICIQVDAEILQIKPQLNFEINQLKKSRIQGVKEYKYENSLARIYVGTVFHA